MHRHYCPKKKDPQTKQAVSASSVSSSASASGQTLAVINDAQIAKISK